MDFALNEEQLELKARMRRFARDVIRPVAPQHDAEESTPWEVMREAREQGLHGLDHLQRMGSDPDGMFGVIGAEELHWGCAGIALAISGSGLAAAGLAASGTPEQIARWVPECFGVGDEIKLGAYAVTEAAAPARTSRACARRRSATATSGFWTGPRSSSPTAGSPTSTSSSPTSTPSSATAARPRS